MWMDGTSKGEKEGVTRECVSTMACHVPEDSQGKAAFLKKGYAPPVPACRKTDG